jgi:hypothetical protein
MQEQLNQNPKPKQNLNKKLILENNDNFFDIV